MLDLRALLEIRQALPLSFSPDGERLLVASNVPGTLQLFAVPARGGELEQLTDFTDPVEGTFLPDGGVLVEMDAGGNERTQLYVLDDGDLEPLVVDERFIHRTPHVHGDLLAYATNRRNGVDFDVVARSLSTGEEQIFELGGNIGVEAISPDGRWIAVERTGDRSGDNDLYLCEVDTGAIEHATPHDDPAEFYAPVWIDGSLVFASNEGRDTFAIVRDRRAVYASEWDLACVADEAGRNLLVISNEDGYSRLTLLDPASFAPRGDVPLPGRGLVEYPVFSPDGSLLAFSFSSPVEARDVYLYDLESSKLTRLTTSPRSVEPAQLVEPTLHRFDSFDGESVPSSCSSRRATGRSRSS